MMRWHRCGTGAHKLARRQPRPTARIAAARDAPRSVSPFSTLKRTLCCCCALRRKMTVHIDKTNKDVRLPAQPVPPPERGGHPRGVCRRCLRDSAQNMLPPASLAPHCARQPRPPFPIILSRNPRDCAAPRLAQRL
eukprot:3252096-Prymnesium_polylepis.2